MFKEAIKKGLSYTITVSTVLAASIVGLNIATKYHTTHLYLDPVIDFTPSEHQLVDTLNQARDGQDIILHINSLGGSVVPMLELMSAIQHTKANLTVEVDGLAASAAGILAMVRPEILHISSQSVFMIHYMIGANGQMVDNKDPNGFPIMIDNMVANEYKGILTPYEILNISIGGQVWLDAHTFADRLCHARGLCNVLK